MKILLFLLCATNAFSANAKSFDIDIFPIFSRYEIDPVAENVDEISPWLADYSIRLQLYDELNDRSRLKYSLAYNKGVFSPELLSPELYDLGGINVKIIEVSSYYSYDIFLSKKLILNPEIGLSCQIPFTSLRAHNNSVATTHNNVFKYNKISAPVLGVTTSVWLKFPIMHKQHLLGIGILGNLPFYRIKLGEYTITDSNLTYPIKTGLGYIALGLSYSFQLNKK